MENAVNSACKIQARRVTQELLKFDENKQVKPRKPMPELSLVPEITEEFIKTLYGIVWAGVAVNRFIWKDFLEKHCRRMTKNLYLFSNYVAYVSYLLIEEVTDAYACFVEILQLVFYFSYYCSDRGHEKFKNTCVELICAIFDKELCIKFEEQGHWISFHEYLEDEENFKKQREFLKAADFSQKLKSVLEKSTERYVTNGVVFKDIPRSEVENHKKAVSFANSVKDTMRKVCKKSYEEILKDFQETERQAEVLFLYMVGSVSGGTVDCEEQFSLQEVQEKSPINSSVSITPETIENITEEGKNSDPFESKNIETIKSPGNNTIPTSENIMKAKALLREMLEYIPKIYELVKFVCEENETDISHQM